MFLNKLSRKKEKEIDEENRQMEKDTAIKPGLSQYVIFGSNTAGVVLHDPEHNYRKVIVNSSGCFENFPGIVQGKWTDYIKGKFDFDAGEIRFQTSFKEYEDGYRCLWEIQPDGRYWEDEDGFGRESASEIVLYADLNAKGEFKGPFRIYEIDGRRMVESEEQHEEHITLEERVKAVLKFFLDMVNEKMPDTGSFEQIGVKFRVPNSLFIACVLVKNSYQDKDKRMMEVMVFLEGTDMIYNHLGCYDDLTSEEMKMYLGSEKAADDVTNSVRMLIESAKKH